MNLDSLDPHSGFRELLRRGATVDHMTPDFPSLSYPNYYSLMTGRHCESHHMTGNYMWDERSDKHFLIGINPDSRLPLWWEGAEPLWVTAQRQGKRVHMYYWPGCEVEILGVRPQICEEYYYNPSVQNFTESLRRSVDALSSGDADLAAVYYEKMDVEGHHFGPESPEVRRSLQELDRALGTLCQRLTDKGLWEQLNVMMFSDHGMTRVQWEDRVIELDRLINMSHILKMMDRGPVVSLWPLKDKFQQVSAALEHVPHMQTYTKAGFPERFHYGRGRFVSPLTLVAEPGWFIVQNKSVLPYWRNESEGPARGWQRGWHGYDNQHRDMGGFFLAAGPDFKENVSAAPILSVDVYNLMCRTLGVEPLPNNGSWSRVEALLSSAGPLRTAGPMRWWILCSVLLLMDRC
uniref:glycerophosphocholine cholinephosphodiesterase n=1 Tax=Knipowitschia caucasica TaxID=637954 RepID=A0AAV2MGZ0_KNICA